LGYDGTVMTACMASSDRDVRGVDVDATKVDEICSEKLPERRRSGRRSGGS
jgi:UDP-glucose 6-dehydrogenase